MFFADLHIHSHYSRATSKGLDIPTILLWAQKKGLLLVGTGDFTHPAWFSEIIQHLEEDGRGLLVPKAEIARKAREGLPQHLHRDVRFILQVEVSTIFRKAGGVRKVHTLVFVPGLEAAKRFSTALARLGNVSADGRPILGLEPLHILELAKNADPRAFIVPAHIWTPHFSIFGAFSGFDSIEECFEDKAGEVFALETGLSSDIDMNRRWSALDRFSLISCSDAHSPSRLGREATVFDCELSFDGIVKALRGGGGLVGTIEFFPEEGKYHFDGHRKCGVRMEPGETRALGGRCPVCGGRLTRGVLGRVEEMADRREPAKGFPPQKCLIPLEEVIAELENTGTAARAVAETYETLLKLFGPELELLYSLDVKVIAETQPLLAEAIRRMRARDVFLEPGYDGEYGRVRVFRPGELEELRGQLALITSVCKVKERIRRVVPQEEKGPSAVQEDLFGRGQDDGLTEEQGKAVEWWAGPVVVIAGPGTGKTRTLVARARRAVQRGDGRVLVVTFTNRAADEARTRLAGCEKEVDVFTFHAFCLRELNRFRAAAGLQPIVVVDGKVASNDGECSVDELVPRYLRLLDEKHGIAEEFQRRYAHVLVDEFQDVSPDQYALLRRLVPHGRGLFVVGDPDQTIYAFRGSDPEAFERFVRDWPETKVFRLRFTHRLGTEVCKIASKVGPGKGASRELEPARAAHAVVRIYSARDPHDEGRFIAGAVRRLTGGLEMNEAEWVEERLTFGQIAVLGRTHEVVEAIAATLEAEGIPVERASDRALLETQWASVIVEALRRAPSDADAVEVAEDALGQLQVPGPNKEAILRLLRGLDSATALARLVLLREIDAMGLHPERVACLTIHAAKGLEFEAVFLAGCEDGVVPLITALREADLAEERRLLYVGLTRAKRFLTVTYSAGLGFGSGRLSRFLRDVEKDVETLRYSRLGRRFRQQSLFGDS